ncbi:MAG: ABC transporter substrate-binding protein [Euryarchaeota archaeon]|nr:ABC transporter substrate-binding protein [Euryarchaeota archaeon]
MKNKTLASLEIAIVFCLLFFVALPSIATATEDETLDIYGNANEDDIIDMRDLTFTARMILRLEDETELADANYDGRVSVADMTQIGLIILSRESKLTLVDSSDRIVTVNKPVEKAIAGHVNTAEAISLLGAWDRVVGIDIYTTDEILFPGASDLPVIRGFMAEDMYYETIFELDPDVFIMRHFAIVDWIDVIDILEPDIPFVCLEFADPETLAENIRKLRYILNTEEKGEEFIAFYEGVVNDIAEETAGLSEGDKPQVFVWPFFFDYTEQYAALAGDFPGIQSQFEIVGAKNIAEDLTGWFPYVSEEWLLGEDIDVILCGVDVPVIPGVCGYDIDDTTVIRETRDWVMDADENPALAGSDAVTNGNVYLYSLPLGTSTRFVVAMAYWAKWLHPELFGDLDPHEIHMTYLEDYMGIDRSEVEDSMLFWPEP